MKLEQRIDLLAELGNYCLSEEAGWREAKLEASHKNKWFTPEFIENAVVQIAREYLQKDKLKEWAKQYELEKVNRPPLNVGLVMAGNIPLVGFHDFLSIFISGHRQTIKPSTRDEVLIRHLTERLSSAEPEVQQYVSFAERLKGCDAYIATGSDSSSVYFDYYFSKYPHLIRRNRTSVAVLNGRESKGELESLSDDVNLYFGLGCRNVTKLYVPENYDFVPLLAAFRKYDYLKDYSKYTHNYDHQLTIMILNKKFYMTNDSILLLESESPFSPISVLHYEFYKPGTDPLPALEGNPKIQCIVGQRQVPFGKAQQPGLTEYADGADTLQFLRNL
ncbi:acyl-CoA reductase [Flavitalea flava]